MPTEMFTGAPYGWALVSAGVKVMPAPRSCAGAPTACASVSGAARVTPVPPAPAVPTVWIVANSTLVPVSMRTTWPAVRPNVKVTLMFVSPGLAAATSVGAKADGALPTDVTVTVSAVPSGSIVSFARASRRPCSQA